MLQIHPKRIKIFAFVCWGFACSFVCCCLFQLLFHFVVQAGRIPADHLILPSLCFRFYQVWIVLISPYNSSASLTLKTYHFLLECGHYSQSLWGPNIKPRVFTKVFILGDINLNLFLPSISLLLKSLLSSFAFQLLFPAGFL